MLEVLCGGLHSVDYMRCGKLPAVETRHADEQSLDQRELGGEECEFLRHAGHSASEHPLIAIRELAAKDGVDQVVFQNISMPLKERLVVAIVRCVVSCGEALQSCGRTVADAGGECVDAFNKARPDV